MIERTLQYSWCKESIPALRKVLARAFSFDEDVVGGVHLFIPTLFPSDIYIIFIIDELEGIEGEKAREWLAGTPAGIDQPNLNFEDLCGRVYIGEYNIFSNGEKMIETGLTILEAMIDKRKMDRAGQN
jgi:hypothetical protein